MEAKLALSNAQIQGYIERRDEALRQIVMYFWRVQRLPDADLDSALSYSRKLIEANARVIVSRKVLAHRTSRFAGAPGWKV